MAERIKATYIIETSFPLEKAVATMAGEQSSGTFVKVPGETAELTERFRAKVDFIEPMGSSDIPFLSDSKSPAGQLKPNFQRAKVGISWNYENVGSNLSTLMATVAGNLFELSQFSGIKLIDIDLPVEYKNHYAGPKFGIEGTQKLTGVYDRPVIGTIIKPSVGLTPEATGIQVKSLIDAGLDFIKDDELMADPPHSPFEKRVKSCMDAINRQADVTGKKAMFAFNISGDIDDMKRRHDIVLAHGGNCIMLSLNWVGISATKYISDFSQMPIHGHRNGWGMFYRPEVMGITFEVYKKIFSLAGVDHLHTNGLRNKFCETDESVLRSITSCQNKADGSYQVMPVVSSGQWADQAADTYKLVGNTNLMYLCGGGITAHPDGMKAGVESIKIAWSEGMKGNQLGDIADTYTQIKKALKFYGKK
ncbi:MAG: ribulose-bisphosphate carboxylase large subunit family protein [Ferruginibacter sp.]